MISPYADELSQIVPAESLPPARLHSEYAVDGLSPMAVVIPQNREQVSGIVRWASQNGVTVFPRGGGTKTGLGNPPGAVGIVVDLSQLNRVIDYQPGDMTATVEAGITLAGLQAELAAARQFVPLESPLFERATVGGALSTALSGPMAHAYGPPRDWLIGVGAVGADGADTKAGGRVVKNVTGYDLNRLYTGSLGTLGIIVEATFKVSPVQPEEYALAAPFDSMREAVQAGWDALNLAAGPSSYLALTSGLARLFLAAHSEFALSQAMGERMEALGLCFVSGRSSAVQRRVKDTSATLLDGGAIDAVAVGNDGPRSARQWILDLGWDEDTNPALTVRMSAPRRIIPNLVDACMRIGLLETPSEILADPGFGSVRLLFWGDVDSQGIREAIDEARFAARQHGASAVVEICHPSIKSALDVWGEEPGSMAIMRRIKDRLDPQHLLNRGRFLGRI